MYTSKRSMKKVTKGELLPVLKDMFSALDCKILEKEEDSIKVTIKTKWGEDVFEDEITLYNRFFDALYITDFSHTDREEYLWQQWLMARGYHQAYNYLDNNSYK